jgi:HK97 gp10 family phage protein
MRVEGVNLDLCSDEITKAAMNRLGKSAGLVADKARQLCPVKTGALKSSIRVGRLKGDPNLDVRIIAGGKFEGQDLFYARWVEIGSIHNKKAHAFLSPALHQSKSAIMNIMENG